MCFQAGWVSKGRMQRDSQTIGGFRATTLVIGTMVGSGIFVSTSGMAKILPDPWLILSVWVAAGVLSALGALTQAEITSRLPSSGGLATYFAELLGRPAGFFYTWGNLLVGASGAIAAISATFAAYAGASLGEWGRKGLALALIWGLTFLNMRGIRLGTWVQALSTSTKITALLLILGAAAWVADPAGGAWAHAAVTRTPAVGWQVWFLAMSGAFWAYDGWGNVTDIASEVREPRKTLPKAIVLGTCSVIVLYVALNAAYLHILGIDAIANAPSGRVAAVAVETSLGSGAALAIAALVMLSTFDTVNASILTNARVTMAMAQRGLFWRRLGQVHPRFGTPNAALAVQAVWASLHLVTGSFESVMRTYVFASWVSYLLIPALLLLARRRGLGEDRAPAEPASLAKPYTGFKVPGYPWVPLTLAACASLFLAATLWGDPVRSLLGLGLVAAGWPFYLKMTRPAGRKNMA